MTEKIQPIPHRLKNMAVGGHVAGAEDIDAGNGKTQQDINADTYRKNETYSKEQLNSMITTPEQEYMTLVAESGDTLADIFDGVTGAADTIYRVGNWDGEEYNTGSYSEYAFDGTNFQLLSKKEPGIDDEPTAGSNNLVKSGSIKRYGVDIDGEMNLAFGVIQGQALSQTFDVSGLEIKDGDRLNFTLSTNLIDSSGIIIYLNSTSFILRNDSTLTKDIEEDLETITVVRTGTDGIIGTGTVTLQVSKDGCINARLQELEEGYANDTLTIKKHGIDIDGYFSPNFNVEEGVGINYTFDVSDLGIKAGDTVVFGLDTLLIDSSGVNLYLNESHYILRNGTNIRINLDSALETIRVNRAGEGIAGTGAVTLYAKKEGCIEDELSALNEGFVTGRLDIKNLAVTFEEGYYYNSSGELVEFSNSIYTTGIDISQYAGLNISIKGTFSSGKSRYCLITTDEGEILKKAREYDCIDAGVMDFGLIPASAKYLKLSFASSTEIDDATIYASLDKESSNVVYVDAVNGSDTNFGGTGDPFASFAKALEATGDDTTIILRGDINEGINIKTKSNQKSLTVIGEKGRKNRILLGTFITDATQYSGNVYSVTLDSFPSREKYPIFQHEVPDANTLITEEERHPLQRGREYRCESTLLLPVSSVEDVVASEAQTYYWDSDNDTLYFKIAEGTDLATNPIVLPNGSSIYGNDGTVQVRIINIDSWYCNFNLTLSHGAVCENCSAKFALAAGGFRWDNAIGVKLYQCEAARIFAGNETNGDGFNAHSTVSEDAMARHTTCMMMDCWSHDNNDDGYSDHERCECSIHGGLFEYNGKGGVTPSYGSHLVCYDVLSRKNYRGFYYIHAATETEGGKYGQMICYNCVAENNTVDGGFRVNGTGNKAILVGCKSIGNPQGYRADSGTTIELIDCGTLSNITDKIGEGTFVFKNTSLLQS